MAIYLGDTKVSPSLNTIIERTITKEDGVITDISTDINTDYSIEDPDNLSTDLPVVTEWTRPQGWPDLDELPVLSEGLYLTYDNRDVDFPWAAFRCIMNTGSYIVAQGHMNGTSWVQDATWTVASNSVQTIDYGAAAYDFVVFKITPASTNHIQQFYFNQIAKESVGTLALRPQYDQYCLERVGKLPYLIYTSGSGDAYRYCCQWMERDSVEFGNAVTSLNAAWYRGRALKKIEWGNWTGENCNITSLSNTFDTCLSIEKIDLTQWKTTNWHVTNIVAMFNACYSMKVCIVPFDTTNWGSGTGKTFIMNNTWSNCLSLERLDLSMWDMSDLNVTIIYQCWYNCYHLKSLNVKNWDTSKWTVNGTNGLYYLFGGCRTLVDIDLSGWNTTNWAPVRADNIFYVNQKRRSFKDIENWNTSNWKIAQFNDAFNGCLKVQELNLSNWNTSNWKVTTLSGTFGQMSSVRTIDLTGWDTSQWLVTNINYVFYYDYNLEEIKGFWDWDVSNWPVTNGLYETFDNCNRLKEIDFSHWNTAKFAFASGGKCDLRYFARQCYNLKKLDMSTFDVEEVNSLNYYSYNAAGNRGYSPFYLCYSLEEFTLPQNYRGHLDMSEMYKLPRSEFIKVFNALSSSPIGTTAKVWIISTKYKLTTADIAIATNKGYTVVQS